MSRAVFKRPSSFVSITSARSHMEKEEVNEVFGNLLISILQLAERGPLTLFV